jgi:hypothetical protein
MDGRGLVVFLIIAALGLVSAGGQSVADGSVHGNVYTNRYFKVTLTLPPVFHVVDLASLNLHGMSRGTSEFLLLAAREGAAPYGIVMMAEKLNVGPSHIVDGQDFLRRVQHGWGPGEVFEGKKLRIQPKGLVFEELDYGIPKIQFDSAIVTRVGEYLLVFRCNAKSAADLKVMDDAVISMHRE